MKEVMEGQASKALLTKLDAAVLEARKTLKPFIVRRGFILICNSIIGNNQGYLS
jgi:hypothetical protein